MLSKKAIEEVHPNSYGFRSRLFTVPKKTGDLRPILNLRPLNQFIPQRHFKMETLKQVCTMINQGDYLTSIDLTDAFMHVLVHQSSRRFLQFTWKGRLFQFRVLPFGMSLSPMVFTKILKPVLRWARRKGIRLTAYLDDLLIVAKDRATSLRHTELVLHKLADLGFLIKRSKSSLIPSQSIQHLGFTINTTNLSLTVPKSKIRDLRREASRLLHRPTSTIRALASFIGKAQSMTIAIFPARLKTRHLLLCKNMALHQTKSWTSPLSLSPAAKDELMWWKEQLLSWNGQSFLPSSPQVEIYTDASDSGWGIVEGHHSWSGQWKTHEQQLHINQKELLTIWKALQLNRWTNQTIRILCDNTTTIAYVNKFGGTRSLPLLIIAQRIWDFCLRTNTRLQLSYVPSAFNPADPPSRRLISQLEWRISPTYFQRLEKKWGPHSIDMFASHLNHQTPRYVSWKPEPTAWATDAMSLNWNHLGRLYLCPPWNLLAQVIAKLQREQTSATLITPWWPTAIWFPVLKNLAQPRPLQIPRSMVLPPPGYDASVLQGNPHWSLTAWNIRFAD